MSGGVVAGKVEQDQRAALTRDQALEGLLEGSKVEAASAVEHLEQLDPAASVGGDDLVGRPEVVGGQQRLAEV